MGLVVVSGSALPFFLPVCPKSHPPLGKLSWVMGRCQFGAARDFKGWQESIQLYSCTMMDDWLENGSNQNKTDQAKRSASVYGGRVGLNAKHAMDCF